MRLEWPAEVAHKTLSLAGKPVERAFDYLIPGVDQARQALLNGMSVLGDYRFGGHA